MHPEIQTVFRGSADFSRRMPNELSDALKDLHEVSEEAREEGFPAPSDLALSNAERLLTVMYEIACGNYVSYPIDEIKRRLRFDR